MVFKANSEELNNYWEKVIVTYVGGLKKKSTQTKDLGIQALGFWLSFWILYFEPNIATLSTGYLVFLLHKMA